MGFLLLGAVIKMVALDEVLVVAVQVHGLTFVLE